MRAPVGAPLGNNGFFYFCTADRARLFFPAVNTQPVLKGSMAMAGIHEI
jgi:hypothetical protein